MPGNPYSAPSRQMSPSRSMSPPSRPPQRQPAADDDNGAGRDKARRLARILAKSKYDTRDDT